MCPSILPSSPASQRQRDYHQPGLKRWYQSHSSAQCLFRLQVLCQVLLLGTAVRVRRHGDHCAGGWSLVTCHQQTPPPPLPVVRDTISILQNDFIGNCVRFPQCVMPFYVATALSGIRRPSWSAPSPGSFVREALGTLGYQSVSYGCLAHVIQVSG